MRFPWSRQAGEIAGLTYAEAMIKGSSAVSDQYAQYVPPYVDFQTAYEYYRTIPEFQNVVEFYVGEILSRDWYFDKAKGGSEAGVSAMNDWAEKFGDSYVIESIVRDWWVYGNSIIGTTDWKPVQMTNMLGIKRDAWGNTQEYYLSVNGKPTPLLQTYGLKKENYIHSKFIDANREAWGLSPAHSLMEEFIDVDGKKANPQFSTWRQTKTDMGKILHKMGSPRMYYMAKGATKDQIEKDIGPLIGSTKPGERTVISLPTGIDMELVPEQIDSKTRFTDSIELLRTSTDIGLGSSANRLIAQPSAMADAREANAKDDTRATSMMEKIRRLFEIAIIPAVTNSKVEFHWGQKDELDLTMEQIISLSQVKIDNRPAISPEEIRAMWVKKGVTLDDALYKKFTEDANTQKQKSDDMILARLQARNGATERRV